MPRRKQDQLSNHNRSQRSQFEKLVCEDGLGYCCPYALFRGATRDAAAIATRLGLHKRTVQRWKEKFKSKELICEKKANCMIHILRRAGK